MPTGYTAAVKDGITFEQFAWSCARAFGALIDMRDSPTGAPIPQRFEPSQYNAVEAEKASAEIERLKREHAESLRHLGCAVPLPVTAEPNSGPSTDAKPAHRWTLNEIVTRFYGGDHAGAFSLLIEVVRAEQKRRARLEEREFAHGPRALTLRTEIEADLKAGK